MMMQHHCQEPVPEAAWTSLITTCHRGGLLNEAIDVFRDMVSSGVPRSSFSLSSILAVFAESHNQGCGGQQVHADAIKRGVDTNQFVSSGLVHMYAKQGLLIDAARAFDYSRQSVGSPTRCAGTPWPWRMLAADGTERQPG
uniref:Pentatricopeptide repeat-containing protein n=1 Tax=Arundo donax TaxID=35708 RepID=A0A0A9C973_ARUDO